MLIDAHAHVFERPRIKTAPDSTTFMSAAEQIAVMDHFGIDKAVILPMGSPDSIPEYQGINEILNICEKYPGRFIPYCNVDPRLHSTMFYHVDAGHFEFILNQYKELGCKGLGEVTCNIYWDDTALLQLFEACEKVGFPVTFHTTIANSPDYGLIDEIGLPRFEKVLQSFPNLIFFGHSPGFWTEISGEVKKEDKWGYPEGDVKPGGAVPRLMRAYPQLYGDISANSGLNAFKRDSRFAYEFIDEFQDRLMLGLDYCSVNNNMHHIEWLKAARDAGHISSEAYEKIMWRNINQAINLGL